MKVGWKSTKLGEVFDVRDGTHDSPKYLPSGYPLVTSKNLKSGSLDFGDIKYISEEDYQKINARSAVHRGDILFAMIGTIGNPTIVASEPNFAIKNVALFKVNSAQNNAFLKYYLESPFVTSKMIKEANGTTQKFVGLGYLRNFPIELPPLPEQQRIVSVLDQTFEGISTAIANAEKNLANARGLFESFANSIYKNKGENWQVSNIGEMCNLMTGGTPSSNKPEYYNEGDIKWIVSGDVNKTYIHDCNGRITELGMKNSSTKYLPENSVIIALNGQGKTRGTVAMLKTKATCNQSIVSIYPNDLNQIIPDYIFYNLKVRYQEIRKLTGDDGNDRRGLNMPIIRSIKISYPKSVTEQNRIVKQLTFLFDETKKLEAIYQQKLKALEDLKKSILHQAFTGHLN